MVHMLRGLPQREDRSRHYDFATLANAPRGNPSARFQSEDVKGLYELTLESARRIALEELQAVLVRALAARPADRFADVDEFRTELLRIATGLPK
jgi:hypothetical protein